jgi:hypothetical protein
MLSPLIEVGEFLLKKVKKTLLQIILPQILTTNLTSKIEYI